MTQTPKGNNPTDFLNKFEQTKISLATLPNGDHQISIDKLLITKINKPKNQTKYAAYAPSGKKGQIKKTTELLQSELDIYFRTALTVTIYKQILNFIKKAIIIEGTKETTTNMFIINQQDGTGFILHQDKSTSNVPVYKMLTVDGTEDPNAPQLSQYYLEKLFSFATTKRNQMASRFDKEFEKFEANLYEQTSNAKTR